MVVAVVFVVVFISVLFLLLIFVVVVFVVVDVVIVVVPAFVVAAVIVAVVSFLRFLTSFFSVQGVVAAAVDRVESRENRKILGRRMKH